LKDDADARIHIAGLRKIFGAHLVLDDVGLDVRRGEAVALLGANGAGKTTLLKILATLARPTRGTAVVAGHDCVRDPEGVRRHVGLVAHGSHVYEDLSALENLRFWATLNGLRASGDDLAAALADVDLDRVAGERVRTFSAGMKRRLSLARFVLARPEVLLLDEPAAGLDQRAKKWLEDRLEAFKTGGAALLMATHSFGRELAVADRIAILAGGRIVLDTPRAPLGPDDIQRLYAFHTEDGA
jgi:heme ABC exporter ATP-binding subunit CcmA